ncbi:MAG: PIN domain-containing protein [Bacteroidales bacterium]|nr:PIN domain-containing protein [Bacteroidales bacterium]MDD3430718.1 PIN domain-containing protein [Bacteroidales bacterium]MDD4360998.1 PIN domain-containing protein [Bacteroidales bacterium]MDD4430916.1 PIN domain-containing protein [Bacteroidales bacterium]
MKKLLLDTNIIIDLLSERQPFYSEAARIFSLADKKDIQISVSALSIATTNYILLQSKKSDEAKQILRRLKLIVQVLSLDDKIVELALNDSDFNDFEDGLQYFTALENGLDAIITRNLKDFRKSKIPVMTAGQYMQAHK